MNKSQAEIQDLCAVAEEFRHMAGLIESIHRRLLAFESSPEGRKLTFIEAAIAVATDGYQPRQRVLSVLRRAYDELCPRKEVNPYG